MMDIIRLLDGCIRYGKIKNVRQLKRLIDLSGDDEMFKDELLKELEK